MEQTQLKERIMNGKTWLFLCAVLAGCVLATAMLADDDGDKTEKYHILRDSDKHSKIQYKEFRSRYLKSINNRMYVGECGLCHFTYQPELLPSRSWRKIMRNLNNHFGEKVPLEETRKEEIVRYLLDNAAEYSSANVAVRITKSVENRTPIRITDVPYIKKKHDHIPSGVLRHIPLNSLSECTVCHTIAERGIYSERYIHIPRYN